MIPASKRDNRKGEDIVYSRYNQEEFKARDTTGGFQIDTLGTNTSHSLNALVAGGKR